MRALGGGYWKANREHMHTSSLLHFCRDINFADEDGLNLRSGRKVTIHCGGLSIAFGSNRANSTNLNSGTRLALIDCHVSFFKSAALAYSLEVENAGDLTAQALTGQGGSALVLQDSIMLMPNAVRLHSICCHELQPFSRV